jgi:hypothetical protein
MRTAITFRDQTERERQGNERGYTFLSSSEAKSLPQFTEFETPVLADHECPEFTRALLRRSLARRRVSFLAVRAFDPAEPEPNDNVS